MFNQFPYYMTNPSYLAVPNTIASSSTGALKGATGILGKLNISSILSNAQKTLNVVNQAIPLYYQVKPMFNNLKTIGKIGKEFRNISNSKNNSTVNENYSLNKTKENEENKKNDLKSKNDLAPTFFI